MKTYAFIDASNIIYGTRDEGWKVDFKRDDQEGIKKAEITNIAALRFIGK